MSLRWRLALSFALLIVLLGASAGLGLRTLGAELDRALADTAVEVGRKLVHILRHDPATPPPGGDAAHFELRREVRVVHAPPGAARPARPAIEDLDLQVRPATGQQPSALLLRREGGTEQIFLADSALTAAVQRYQQQLGWGLLSLIGVGLLLALGLAARISAPLAALARAAERLGRGEWDAPLAEQGPPEVRASIAAFKRMREDLQRLDAQAARLRADRELVELGEIGRGLAHSLRNPLHALGLSLDALAEGAADARAQERIATGREQLARIDQALRGFLALAAGAGAQPESVRLKALVDDVVLEASQRAQGLRFKRDCADLSLTGVPAELRILLHTLVINAVEASPDGGLVEIKLESGGDGQVRIAVGDAGPGLAPAIRARLFQPHTTDKPTGAGMGLYLAERLARLRYAGTLRLIDRAPAGTLAILELRERSAPHD